MNIHLYFYDLQSNALRKCSIPGTSPVSWLWKAETELSDWWTSIRDTQEVGHTLAVLASYGFHLTLPKKCAVIKDGNRSQVWLYTYKYMFNISVVRVEEIRNTLNWLTL